MIHLVTAFMGEHSTSTVRLYIFHFFSITTSQLRWHRLDLVLLSEALFILSKNSHSAASALCALRLTCYCAISKIMTADSLSETSKWKRVFDMFGFVISGLAKIR